MISKQINLSFPNIEYRTSIVPTDIDQMVHEIGPEVHIIGHMTRLAELKFPWLGVDNDDEIYLIFDIERGIYASTNAIIDREHSIII